MQRVIDNGMFVTLSWIDEPMSRQYQKQEARRDNDDESSGSASPAPTATRGERTIDFWSDALALSSTPAAWAASATTPGFGGQQGAFGSGFSSGRMSSHPYGGIFNGDAGSSVGFSENKSSPFGGMFSGIFSAGRLPPLNPNPSYGDKDTLERVVNQFSGLSKTSAEWSIDFPSLNTREGDGEQKLKGSKDAFWNTAFMDQLEGHPTTSSHLPNFSDNVAFSGQGRHQTQNHADPTTPQTGTYGFGQDWNQSSNMLLASTKEREKAPASTPKKRSRKVIPDVKEFVDEYNDRDCLFGRGGRSNHHPGNQRYLELVNEKKPLYRSSDDKKEKRQIIQDILDAVWECGGRFLELDQETSRWYVSHPKSAYGKVGQALRDRNDPEARLLKREKYGPTPKRKKRTGDSH